MLVIKQHRIYRQDLQNNPDVLYIFGDNLERTGFGGQAKEMRGEPNAFGVVTKRKAAHGSSDCYFFDSQKDAKDAVVSDIIELYKKMRNCEAVIIPLDGIGTGLAKLSEYAPILLNYINKELENLA